MKPNEKMLFGNLFDDVRITPTYLARFANDTKNKLSKNNTSNQFDIILNPLVLALTPLYNELGQVENTLNEQVGKTQTVDDFIAEFAQTIKVNYVHIASKLGGENTPVFKQFFPKGKTEYNAITKTKMPILVERLKLAATNNSTALGTELTTQLQAFKASWEGLRDNQLQSKAAVSTNRTERTSNRKAVEICLLKAIHFIADKYIGNVQECMVYFDFNLLFGSSSGAGDIATEPPIV